MKRKIIVFGLIVGLIFGAGLLAGDAATAVAAEAEAPEGYLEYTENEYFTAYYPGNFSVDTEIDEFMEIVYFYRFVDDRFNPNVNVVVEKGVDLTIDEYLEANLENLDYQFPDFELEQEPESFEVDGYDGKKIVYQIDAEEGLINFEQILITTGDNAFVITYANLVEYVEENREAFENLVENFVIR